jgi:hypothetical protein
MKPFLSFQGSRACFFSALFTGDSCPLRIPFDRLRAAVSPIPKSRKELRPPASLSRNNFMALLVRRMLSGAALLALGEICEYNSMGLFGVKKRHPYPSAQRRYGAKALIEFLIFGL